MKSGIGKVGLIPAAGYARRLGNINGSKEMLPFRCEFGYEPVCHSLIRQFMVAGITDIVLVTREEKIDLIEHLDNNLDLDVVINKVYISMIHMKSMEFI